MVKYNLFKNYLLRQAVLPTEEAKKNPLMTDAGQISVKDVWQNYIFRQAVLCASESLYNSMNDYIHGKISDPKWQKQIELSISQYWMRMSTRATPFGLFSSVGIGSTEQFGTDGSLYAAIDADSEWIFLLSTSIERQYIEHLSFLTNDIISDSGRYYELPYVPGNTDLSSIYINKDCVTTYIIEKCKGNSKTFSELLNEIRVLNPNLSYGDIKKKIEYLLSNEGIISSLRPNLYSPNLIKDLSEKLREHHIAHNLSAELDVLWDRITFVSTHIFNENVEDIILEVISTMRAIKDSSHVLKINLVKDPVRGVICENDVEETAEFATFFVSLVSNLKDRFTVYDEYKDVFLNEYGEYKTIPLTKLLSKKTGIGCPHTYKEFQKKIKGQKVYPNQPSSSFMFFFMKKYRQAIQNGTAIVLDDMVKELGEKKIKDEAPESFDLLFKIAYDENKNKIFVCNKDFGAVGAGRTIGRFSSGWFRASEVLKELSQYNSARDDYIICDLVYLPRRLNLGNVVTCSRANEYSLSFYQYATGSHIPLSDIYVMIDHNRFFLVSKKYGKKIKVNTNNLLYYYGDSPEIRFIKEIQLDGIIHWENDTFNFLSSFDYMPEIRYKSFVLRPETWTIVPPENFESFEKFDDWFVEKYGFLRGKNVSLLFADNEMMINLNNTRSRYLLFKQHLKENVFTIVNSYNTFEFPYATEVSLSFIRDDIQHHTDKACAGKNGCEEYFVTDTSNMMTLGIECITIKIYGCADPYHYIANILKELIEKLKKEKIIDSFFFLHYADPLYHIRVRFFKKGSFLNIGRIVTLLNEHVYNEFVSSFELVPYERELERYGGVDCILVAEKIFHLESEYVICKLSNCSDDQKEKLYVLSCLDYLKMWGWKRFEQYEWLAKCTDSQKYRAQWRKERNNYNKLLFNKIGEKDTEFEKKKRLALEEYKTVFAGDRIVQERILAALLHMSYNRYFGMNHEKEVRLLSYAKNLVGDIIFRNSDKIITGKKCEEVSN